MNTPISAFGFLSFVAVPLACAWLLPWIRGEQRARSVATFGATLTFAIACVLAVLQHGGKLSAEWSLGPAALHFALDGLSGPLTPLFALLTLAFVVGGSRSFLGISDLRSLFTIEAFTLLGLCTDDLLVLALAWSLPTLPLGRLSIAHRAGDERALVRRMFRTYHGLGISCFLVACLVILLCSPAHGLFGLRLSEIGDNQVPERARPFVFAGLAIATLVRLGVAPFHSWLPVVMEGSGTAVSGVIISMRTGIYVLVRVAVPAFPALAHSAMPTLIALALCSGLYGALGALAQHNLRRMIGFLVVSQSGLMLTGVALGDAMAIGGALLYWLGFATATTGLVLMVSALEARTGMLDMRKAGGIVSRLPVLSGCFFLFGLASIAIPGSVAFVAEDLLVHGALDKHPLLTLVMIAATVLNTITFVRAYKATFLGEARAPERSGTLRDLLPRERALAVALLLALLVAGLVPGPLIAMQAPAARAIAFSEQGRTHPVP